MYGDRGSTTYLQALGVKYYDTSVANCDCSSGTNAVTGTLQASNIEAPMLLTTTLTVDTKSLTDSVSTKVKISNFCGDYKTSTSPVYSWVTSFDSQHDLYGVYTVAQITPDMNYPKNPLTVTVGLLSHPLAATVSKDLKIDVTHCETSFEPPPVFESQYINYRIDKANDMYFNLPSFTATNNALCDFGVYVDTWVQLSNSTTKYPLPSFFELIVDPDNGLNVTLFLPSGFDQEKTAYVGTVMTVYL